MDALIMVSIMTLLLFSGSGYARAATLIVSNQLQTRGNVPVFVTCHGTTPKMSKSVPLGQVSLREISPIAGNNTTDELTAGSREQKQMICLGTFYGIQRFRPTYVLYDSNKDSTMCKNVCLVVVKDDGFYRWNNDKNAWDRSGILPPFTWN